MCNIDLNPPKPELRKYIDHNELLFHARYLLLKDLHIELYKIIKDTSNNKDNIFKILRAHDSKLSITLLAKLKNFSENLKTLTDTRDKAYAHLDPEFENFLGKYEVENYYEIFRLIEEAIIILGYKSELLELLKTIPSRNEFHLFTK